MLTRRFAQLLIVMTMSLGPLPLGLNASPPAIGSCDIADAVAAFVAAWNLGEPSLIPLLDDGVLAISDPEGELARGAVTNPVEYIAHRPAEKDVLAIPQQEDAAVYASGRDPGAWSYVVQPMMRSIDEGSQRQYQLVASVNCSTDTFGRITLHEPAFPVVGHDGIQASDSTCTAEQVTQPVSALLTAIGEGDAPAIRAQLYTPTGEDLIDIVRLGEYSFLMPNGDVLQRGDATSFPKWITDQLASDWVLIPLELYWSNTVPTTVGPEGGTVEGLAGVQFFFLMVDEETRLAWRGVWKGVVIDCASGRILSLHGGTA